MVFLLLPFLSFDSIYCIGNYYIPNPGVKYFSIKKKIMELNNEEISRITSVQNNNEIEVNDNLNNNNNTEKNSNSKSKKKKKKNKKSTAESKAKPVEEKKNDLDEI